MNGLHSATCYCEDCCVVRAFVDPRKYAPRFLRTLRNPDGTLPAPRRHRVDGPQTERQAYILLAHA